MPKGQPLMWYRKYGEIAKAHAASTIFNTVSLHLDRKHMTWHYVSQALEPLMALGLTLSSLGKSLQDTPIGATIALIILVLGTLVTCPLGFPAVVWAHDHFYCRHGSWTGKAVLGYLTIIDNSKRGVYGQTADYDRDSRETIVQWTEPEPEELALSVSNIVRVTTMLAALIALPMAVVEDKLGFGLARPKLANQWSKCGPATTVGQFSSIRGGIFACRRLRSLF